MMAVTHMALGTFAWTVLTKSPLLIHVVDTLPRPPALPVLFGVPMEHVIAQPGAAIAMVALGSILPGIDNPLSRFGWQVPLISLPLSWMFGTRGFSHSLLIAALLIVVLLFCPVGYWLLPLVLGYLVHLVADFFTRAGLPVFWPNHRHFGIGIFPTATLSDFLLLGAALAGTAFLRFGGAI
jgi:inner membrane protein